MKRNAVLWVVQGVVAAVFLFAGGLKLVLPPEAMKGPVELPVAFLRFIGTCEVLGAVGLILPGLLRIRRALTPIAASGHVVIMIGATVVSLMAPPRAAAIVPFVVGLLAAFIAYGRGDWLRDPELEAAEFPAGRRRTSAGNTAR